MDSHRRGTILGQLELIRQELQGDDGFADATEYVELAIRELGYPPPKVEDTIQRLKALIEDLEGA